MAGRSCPALSVLLLAVAAASPARSAPFDTCALLTPYLRSPYDHFSEMRGVKTGDNTWDAKPMPEAQAMNAKCTITTYLKDRFDLDCDVRFDGDKIDEQGAFYRDAVTGLDFCLANLNFGDSVDRASAYNDNPGLRVESVTWHKALRQDGRIAAQFGASVEENLFKGGSSRREDRRDVKVTVFFSQPKP